jgi:hypothetical protein
MDTTQLLLTIVLSLTTILLIIVGIQVIFILRELRKSLQRFNRVIDGFESVGFGLDHGINEVVGFLNGMKMVIKTVDAVRGKKHDKSK